MPVNRRFGAAIAATLVLTSAACGTDTFGGSDAPFERLDIGITTAAPAVGDNNPFLASSSATRLGYRNVIYEPLVMPTSVDAAEPGIPWLASAWSWSPDGTTLTVIVRDGVRFSDGTPLTSADVAYTFQLLATHPALNPAAVPYRAVTTKRNTVSVTFSVPPNALRDDILDTVIVPAHIWSTLADPTTATVPETVGTGPFTITATDRRSVVLRLRTGYWRALPKVQELRYTAYPDPAAQDRALVDGDTDWSPAPAPSNAPNHLHQWFPTPAAGASYSIRHWVGWPDAHDPYARARPTEPSALTILLRLTPAL